MNVIVVDDERIILDMETKMVQNALPDAKVYPFRFAEEAEEFAGGNRIDIAILDITIHNENGVDLARKLRGLNPSMGIIFCTAYSESEVDTSDVIGSRILMKPVTDDNLREELESVRHPLA